jgi:hypothetical protein
MTFEPPPSPKELLPAFPIAIATSRARFIPVGVKKYISLSTYFLVTKPTDLRLDVLFAM